MRSVGKFLLLMWVFSLAQVPTFHPAVSLPQKASCSSSPCMADWNGDGFDDLITGDVLSQNIGKIRLYLGSDTLVLPLFNDYSFLQADDSDIVVPACFY